MEKVAAQTENKSYSISETGEDRAKLTTDCLYKVIHEYDVSICVKTYDLGCFFLWQTFMKLLQHMYNISPFGTTFPRGLIRRNKQLHAHSGSFEIYSGIARFPCDDTTSFLFIDCSDSTGDSVSSNIDDNQLERVERRCGLSA